VKKLLAFVLTFGLVCAMTMNTVGCSKKEPEKAADSSKPAADAGKADAGKADAKKPS
jgi:hypothetical protein